MFTTWVLISTRVEVKKTQFPRKWPSSSIGLRTQFNSATRKKERKKKDPFSRWWFQATMQWTTPRTSTYHHTNTDRQTDRQTIRHSFKVWRGRSIAYLMREHEKKSSLLLHVAATCLHTYVRTPWPRASLDSERLFLTNWPGKCSRPKMESFLESRPFAAGIYALVRSVRSGWKKWSFPHRFVSVAGFFYPPYVWLPDIFPRLFKFSRQIRI